MAELVQVIVDVPTMQTNRPYTYRVPERLERQVQPGMRVMVPFGRGSREVQGFVVAVDQPGEFDGDLKDLAGVMDLSPVLNDELLKLAGWLADQTYAFKITAFYTMLPSLLKAQTTRLVRLVDEVDEQTRFALFADQDELDLAKVQTDPLALSQLMRLRRAGKVVIDYRVHDRAQAKQITTITPTLSFDDYEGERLGVLKNAHAQRNLLDYLQSLAGKTVPLKQAQEESGLSAATFTTGAKRGWLKKGQAEVYRDPSGALPTSPTAPLTLNQEQAQAVKRINQATDQRTAETFLLQGVTGSGKTEVYLRAIERALANGRSALMLVPEISLTPQIVSRVRGRFGKQVAVLHSGLSNGERYDEWRRIKRGEAKVVVGARSAVFAPLDNVGLIIMDEEHESSYKQDDAPRYHARDVAKWRAAYHHAPLVLGSATPSLESRARAATGLYHRLTLLHRVNQRPLPPIQVVDMKREVQARGETNYSLPLLNLLTDRLNKGQQSILMLNRRGFSSFVMCRDCGYVPKCPNCDISLTLHMDSRSLKCHYCGHEERIPNTCPNCQGHRIRYYGTGTEKAVAELQTYLPTARIIRMDVDTTRRKGMHEKLLTKFGNHEADILLGTQMIAKGLDFPGVTLVGVLNADTGLDLPDFRSSERTFDLLAQVAGRAGRADEAGQVVIQTFNPDNYVIQLARAHDYERFFVQEMNLRKLGAYPPYYYTVRVMGSHPDEQMAARVMQAVRQELVGQLDSQTIILGPTPRAIARLKNRYYYQIVIKYRHDPALHARLTAIMEGAQQQFDRETQVMIDPDPQYFL